MNWITFNKIKGIFSPTYMEKGICQKQTIKNVKLKIYKELMLRNKMKYVFRKGQNKNFFKKGNKKFNKK